MSPTARKSTLRLLPRTSLCKTGDVDQADWNYRPLLRTLSRLRFKLIRDLLGNEHYGRILEVGFGSGVFMPELSRRCDELFGVDIHQEQAAVAANLAKHGVKADLRRASVTSLPFADGFFDLVVSVSALEFVEDLDAACGEMARVMKPKGALLVVTPRASALLDLGLKVLTGRSAKHDFAGRREGSLATLARHFRVDGRRQGPAVVPVYTAGRFVLK